MKLADGTDLEPPAGGNHGDGAHFLDERGPLDSGIGRQRRACEERSVGPCPAEENRARPGFGVGSGVRRAAPSAGFTIRAVAVTLTVTTSAGASAP